MGWLRSQLIVQNPERLQAAGRWVDRSTDSARAGGIGIAQADEQVVELHEALEQLSALDSRKAQIVELKYFGGLNYNEIAEVLKISRITVRRDWEFAKVWLYTELRGDA